MRNASKKSGKIEDLDIGSGDCAADGGIVDAIRNYMMEHRGLGGSDNREYDIAMNVDPSSGTVTNQDTPHMAEGDIIGPPPDDDEDKFSVGAGGSSTVKALPLNPASVPPPMPEPSEDYGEGESTSGVPPEMAKPAPSQPVKPLPGMPPDVTPDDLQTYLSNQRASLQKYSPDRQYDQEMSMLKARKGVGSSLANAGATFADALMQGVARAGDPGFAKQISDRQNDMAAQSAGAVERARQGTMQQMDATQKIDAQDPASPLSKTYQKAFAPIFQQMGYGAKATEQMPASQIQTLADLGVRYADAQTQMALKKAMLNVQSMSAAAGMANMQSERRETALKELEAMPWYSRLLHPKISGQLSKEAGIGDEDSNFEPDVMNYAKTHGISPDQAQAIKNKRTGAS